VLNIDGLPAAINAETRKFERTISLPASQDAIARLCRLAGDALETGLPEDYLTLPGRSDW